MRKLGFYLSPQTKIPSFIPDCAGMWSHLKTMALVKTGLETKILGTVSQRPWTWSWFRSQSQPPWSWSCTVGLVKKGKNIDLYSAYRVLHISNALTSLN